MRSGRTENDRQLVIQINLLYSQLFILLFFFSKYIKINKEKGSQSD